MKMSTKSPGVHYIVFKTPCYKKETRKRDEPVSVDLQRVQKRRVSSFVHDPVAASFTLGPRKMK